MHSALREQRFSAAVADTSAKAAPKNIFVQRLAVLAGSHELEGACEQNKKSSCP